jgi:hypothetical protein
VSEISKPEAETASTPEPQYAWAVDPPCHATRGETMKRLDDVKGGPFFAALLAELKKRLTWQFAAGEELEKVQNLVDRAMALNDAESVRKMLLGVRQAMKRIEQGGPLANQELAAAAGLHYIGFRQLVQRDRIAPSQGEFLLLLSKTDPSQNSTHPEAQRIIGVIVVSAIFGGLVEFDAAGLTRSPLHMRKLLPPENADWSENAIDRALFGAWFPTDERAPGIAGGTLPMTDDDYSRLKARIQELREGDELAVGVSVSSGEHHQALLSSVGKKFKIPILLETSVAVEEALGMSPSDFLAQMGEYWKLDTELRQSLASALVAVTSQSTNPSTQGDKPVTNNTFNIKGNAAVTLATDNATATSSLTIQNGLDAAALTPLLQTLAAAIAALDDSHAKKAGYEADLQVLVDQSKAAKPDKLRIANALENLKKAPEYLKGGEAIVTAGKAIVDAATTLYHSVASFLTSNPVLTA